MNDINQQTPAPESNNVRETERTKQVRIFGWTFGVCALVAGGTLADAPTWPVAFGVAVIAVVGACVFSTIFKRG